MVENSFLLGGDLEVNRMGFGAMRLTGKGIWGPPEDREECIAVLQRTAELGINFIDTADSYGPYVSEELIAEALYPYPEDMVIATKGGFIRTGPDKWTINCNPERLRDELEGSLERLNLDRIDLYQLHRIDPDVPFEEQFEYLSGIQGEGLVKHIGLSEVSVDDIKRAEEYVEIVSVQNRYSVDYRKWEDVLKYCEQRGIAFIPWYPIGGGNMKIMEKLKQIGSRYDASPQQVALSWLYNHSNNILLIPGTSKVLHLEENHASADLPLSEEDIKELESD